MRTTIGIILFPLVCLLLSFAVLISDPFTILLLDNSEAVEPTKQLMAHYFGEAEMPDVFDEDEQSHLIDVKKAIWNSFIALLFLTAALIACMTGEWKKIIRYGTYLLFAIILLSIVIPFDTLFFKFHEVVFPQGNWMFSADSTLKMFYPDGYFVKYGIAIAIHAIFAAMTVWHIGHLKIVSRRG